MALIKTKKADLRGKYNRFFASALIISLMLMITAFKYFPSIELENGDIVFTQEIITVEDIVNTRQETRPPVPPKPVTPIETLTDENIEDIILEDTNIDYTEDIGEPPPIDNTNSNRIVEDEPVVFVAVEEMPEIVGGLDALYAEIEYPEIARKAGIEGLVIAEVIVSKTGEPVSVKIIKSIGGGCEDEVIDAVKKLSFTPGKQRGKPVRVKVTVPVRFKLN